MAISLVTKVEAAFSGFLMDFQGNFVDLNG